MNILYITTYCDFIELLTTRILINTYIKSKCKLYKLTVQMKLNNIVWYAVVFLNIVII